MEKLNKELLSKITILYVEDENSISEQVEFFFSKYVKKFYLAKNGIEGIELFNKVKPNILVTDIQMPQMNGLDMIKELSTFKHNVPIIITTAYSDAEYFLRAIELGVDKFVIKPVNLIDLISGVQQLFLKNHLQSEITEKDLLLDIVNKNVLYSITDLEGKIIDVSDAFCELTGYLKSEIIGEDFRIIKHEDVLEDFSYILEDTKNGKDSEIVIKNKGKGNIEFWSKVDVTPIYKEGKIVKIMFIRQDITDKKKLEELAIKDELTQVYNRRYFNQIQDSEIRRVKRENTYLSLLCIDIDYFKKYNDSFGHLKGDEILIKISQCLKSNLLRATDYLFRVGGEEFCILFSGMNVEESVSFSENIIKSVEQLGIKQKDKSVVTISAGLIVQKGKDISDSMTFYRYSDDALYEAKEKGKNQVVLSKFSK